MRNVLIVTSVVVLLQMLPSRLLGREPAKDVSRVLPAGKLPDDARLGKPRTLRDAYHPWQPPTSKAAWEREAQAIRERVLVSNGLWPMPPKTPLKPVIHGKIDRGDYTVEKVFFASFPGHYVTGNLYRPKKITGKAPAVLSPHGHWRDGRFYDAGKSGGGQRNPKRQIEAGAEKHLSGARYPLQARMVQLARLGCIVFHYDMVGYADSRQIAHGTGFTDALAGLRLQNFMGLQTWNSIRALDFLLSLPEVDASRVGVTGASGGGTQTFMLCAVDPRPAAAFPAVMVSTNMQGGCVCENASYLRIGINNIAIAALFAPRPMALSGADDWTVDIETKGLPELRQVYSFYGKADFVHAKARPQFKHNYNQVSREMMYDWFNTHLKLGHEGPIAEQDFQPIPPAELSVFDAEHPLPKDAKSAAELREYLTDVARKQFADLLPASPDDVAEYKRIVGAAARVMLDTGLPTTALTQTNVTTTRLGTTRLGTSLTLKKGLLGRSSQEQIPFVVIQPNKPNGSVVLWIDEAGKSHLFGENGRPTAAVQKLLDAGISVASADVFLTGEFVPQGQQAQLPAVDEKYHGYTFGYNRPVLSNRVRDVLTVIRKLLDDGAKPLHLVGTGRAGRWTLLARGLAGDRVGRTIVDLAGSGFEDVHDAADPLFLPGALKYGGIGGLGALTAPAELTVAGTRGVSPKELKPLRRVYQAAAIGRLTLDDEGLGPNAVVEKLVHRGA